MTNDLPGSRACGASDIRPHDLLWISGAGVLSTNCAPPEWVWQAMAATPVAVVRRDICREGMIPVGIRGRTRSERFAAFVALREVRQRVTPEDLATEQCWKENQRPDFAAIRRALETLAARWPSIVWGPAGSVGFELATGAAVVTRESDLDLIIRAPQRISKKDAGILLQSLAGLAVHADLRIETPFGSVAIEEYTAPMEKRILMKTCAGPMLVVDPWAQPMPVAV